MKNHLLLPLILGDLFRHIYLLLPIRIFIYSWIYLIFNLMAFHRLCACTCSFLNTGKYSFSDWSRVISLCEGFEQDIIKCFSWESLVGSFWSERRRQARPSVGQQSGWPNRDFRHRIKSCFSTSVVMENMSFLSTQRNCFLCFYNATDIFFDFKYSKTSRPKYQLWPLWWAKTVVFVRCKINVKRHLYVDWLSEVEGQGSW